MSIPLALLDALLVALPTLLEKSPEPEDVKAGWIGFGVFLALVAAVVVLSLSLRKHLGRVKFEEKRDDEEQVDDEEQAPNGTS